jgi:hypothetical protein
MDEGTDGYMYECGRGEGMYLCMYLRVYIRGVII